MIVPQMLPWLALNQDQLDYICAQTPGGAGNIQNIYGLTPLQQGILFHHLSQPQDPYIIPILFSFADQATVAVFLRALEFVIARYDVLRTMFLWDQLPEPVQVVQRTATLAAHWQKFDNQAQAQAFLQQQLQRPDGLSLQSAPLMHAEIAWVGAAEEHQVLLRFHHLVTDHVGLEVLAREIALFLQAKHQQLATPMQFSSFIGWLKQQSPTQAEQYFTAKLADFAEPSLPFGLRDIHLDGQGAVREHHLMPVAQSRLLRQLAAKHQVSPAALFHAAWSLVIATCSATTDVVFGSVLLGRTQHTDMATMVGTFINTLPVRVTLDDLSAAELIRQMQSQLNDLLQYEHTPLVQAKRCSAVPADMPLFSALLNFRHSSAEPAQQQAAEPALQLLTSTETSNYPFELTVDDLGSEFRLKLQLVPQINVRQVMDYTLKALEHVLDALNTGSAALVGDMSLLSEAEVAEQIKCWGRPDRQHSLNAPVSTLISQVAQLQPMAVALCCEEGQLSYQQLDHMAGHFAAYLRQSHKVQAGDFIAVKLERSIYLLPVLLGIWRAGAAYVPLDPLCPPERQKLILQDCQATLGVSDSGIDQAGIGQIRLDDPEVLAVMHQSCAPEQSQSAEADDPELPAYVLYTSGTTGVPKGVLLLQRNVRNFLAGMLAAPGLKSGDRLLAVTSISFDIHVLELFLPLLAGARLVIANSAQSRDARALRLLLQQHQITIMQATPASWKMLLADGWQPDPGFTSLCGGEALPQTLVDKLCHGGAVLWNMYGPTETCVWSVCGRMQPAEPIHVGRPVTHTELYILSAKGQLLPAGVIGELWIGGQGVSPGYLNQPALSNKMFVAPVMPQICQSSAGGKLFRTHDLARWLPDGRLQIMGRADQQLKIRGYRIEPGEIEYQLQQSELVTEAVVVAVRDPQQEPILVAYVVPAKPAVAGNELHKVLSDMLLAVLPAYMVPALFVQLSELPLTANGKIDRKQLSAPDFGTSVAPFVAPVTPLEQVIAKCWQHCLGLSHIGVHDNFFAMGGHSIIAVQVVSQLGLHGIRISPLQLFAYPTIAGLAASLQLQSDAQESESVPANLLDVNTESVTPEMLPLTDLSQQDIDQLLSQIPGGVSRIQDIYDLGPLQEGILFLHIASETADPYLLQTTFTLPDHAAVNRFIEHLQLVITRHDVLRTAVFWQGLSRPVQVVFREAGIPVHWHKLSETQNPEHYTAALMQQPCRMTLTQAPLLSLHIVSQPSVSQCTLLLRYHHLVTDQMGIRLVCEELQLLQNGQDELLPAVRQYRDFIASVRQSANQDAASLFFRRMLGDKDNATLVFNITTDPAGQSIRQQIRLADELAAGLRNSAALLHVSPAVLMHCAWALVVAACAGDKDVVFGTVLSGQVHHKPQAGQMLGVLVNTLPIRVNTGGATARSLVQQVSSGLQQLLNYVQVPLVVAQRSSPIEAPLPLFNTLLNYRHTEKTQPAVSGQLPEPVDFSLHSHYPVELSVDDDGQSFQLTLQTHAGYPAERLLGYLQHALAGMLDALAQPEERPAGFCLLSTQERAQQQFIWNNTRSDYPQQQCVHQLFAARAALQPEQPAVVCDGVTLSYAELDRRANQLSHYLRAQYQVAPEQLIGLCLERSELVIIAMLAVLKAGAAYVPLDAGYPKQRLSLMQEDAGLAVILVQQSTSGRTDAEVQLVLDDPVVQRELQSAPCTGVDAQKPTSSNQLAYVIYTSGSTGRPKGVMIEHRSLTNHVTYISREYGLAAGVRCLQLSSVSFDKSVEEIFPTLCSGATLVIFKQQLFESPQAFTAMCRQYQVDVLNLTPAFFHEYVVQACNGELQGIRHISVGGDKLNSQDIQDYFNRHQQPPRLLNVYGPTEVTVDACYTDVDLLYPNSIGKPVANAQCYVLDAQLQLVPVGVIGELYIGGVGVARGYLNRPELTAERFIANPLATGTGDRLYRTGDLVRWLEHGAIEYLGRADHQVKVRGFRIEPGEIESCLMAMPLVGQAVVVAIRAPSGGQQLVAYLTVASEYAELSAEVVTQQAQRQLAATLPEYMVPELFMVLPALPINPNGKIDRHALPHPDSMQSVQRFEAPQTQGERVIAAVWQEVLSLPQVSRTDHFFRLGGHSLLLTRVLARLQQVLQIHIPLKMLFESPVLSKLAAQLDQITGVKAQVKINHVSRSQRLPLSYAQHRLWMLDQIDGGGIHYTMPAIFKLSGQVDSDALEYAFVTIVQRHEALRTLFLCDDQGEVYQQLQPASRFRVQSLDISAQSATTIQAQIQQLLAQPFILSQDYLLRVHLLRDSAESAVLLINMHHIAADGHSVGLLMHELSLLYRARQAGLVAELPELPVQYADYAYWQRQWLSGDVLEQQLQYWEQQLHGLPQVHQLPIDRPRPLQQSYAGASYCHQIPAELTARLATLCHRHDATLFMGIQTLFAILLARFSNEQDISMGTPVSNREQPQLEQLIGFFVNTLVLRNDLTGKPGFSSLLAQSKAMLLAAYEHQHTPFELVVERLKPERTQSYTPLFQIMLVFNPAVPPAVALPGLITEAPHYATTTAKFDLTLHVNEEAGALTLNWEFNTDLFNPESVQTMASAFECLLDGILADPELNVYAINMLPPALMQQVTVDWNHSKWPGQADLCMHELFMQQLIAAPDHIATIDAAGHTLTYLQLYSQVVQLAAQLQPLLPVSTEPLIAIRLPKSPLQLVAALAVQYVGAAYLPLETDWPASRCEQILRQADVQLLITTSSLTALSAEGLSVCYPQPAAAEQSRAELLAQASGYKPVQPPASLAYVIFTSGSTGKPKGVAIEHGAAVNTLLDINRQYGITAADKVLAVSAFSFDLSVYDYFGMLAAGGTVVFPQPELAKNPQHWLELTERFAVTVWNTVPVSAALLVEQLEEQRRSSAICFKAVMMSGDWIDPQLPARLWQSFPGSRLYSLGGATEGSIWSIHYPIEQDTSALSSVPYGRPMSGQSFFILNDMLQPCPPQVTGELFIGGLGVAREYYRDSELTGRQFLWHPQLKQRLYRTGDLGRYRSDGLIEFRGRRDNQIKIRGFRVELGEIEHTLKSHPFIGQAVVDVQQTASGDKVLVAYLVLHNEQVIASRLEFIEQCREWLRSVLPHYMVPQAFEILSALPVTANNKVDRKALPAPQLQHSEPEMILPADAFEASLCAIWQQIFANPQLGMKANFFDLGGHSLLATRLIAKVRSQLGLQATLGDVFLHPQLQEFANQLRLREQESLTSELPETMLQLSTTPGSGTIFCFNPGAGTAHCYGRLAAALSGQYQLVGLHSPLIYEPQFFADFKALVNRYVQLILRYQTEGPVTLLGYSSGGVLAYEAACQLVQQGYQVRVLLLDSYATMAEYEVPSQAWYAPIQLALQEILLLQPELDWNQLDATDVPAALSSLSKQLRLQFPEHYIAQVTEEMTCRYLQHFITLDRLKRGHCIRQSALDLVLFRAELTPPADGFNQNLNWDLYSSGSVRILPIQQSHQTMIESAELATSVAEYLRLPVPHQADRDAANGQNSTTHQGQTPDLCHAGGVNEYSA